MSAQLVQLFRTITNDQIIPTVEITKFLKWSKDSVQQALNYYYRRKEKSERQKVNENTALGQNEDVFEVMKTASEHQVKTEKYIEDIKHIYKLPVTTTLSKRNATNDKGKTQQQQQQDQEFKDADYLQGMFNKYENKAQQMVQNTKESIKKGKKLKTINNYESMDQPNRNTKSKTQTYQQERQSSKSNNNENVFRTLMKPRSQPQPQSQMNQLPQSFILGSYLAAGLSTTSQALGLWSPSEAVQYQTYLSEGPKRVGSSAERTMNMRLLRNGRCFGRLQDQEARVLVPLLHEKFIKVSLSAHNIPRKVETFTPFMLRVNVCLMRKAITVPVVETYDDKILQIYSKVVKEISLLFQRVRLNVIKEALIIKRKPVRVVQSIEYKAINQENEIRQRKEDQRKRTDPFYKTKQLTIEAMIKSNQGNQSNEKSNKSQSIIKQNKNQILIQQQSLNNFFQLAQFSENELIPLQPKANFKSTLYPYQATALSWMLQRQNEHPTTTYQQHIHPLWTQFSLPYFPYRLFVNELTSQISTLPPLSATECRGGILADEMGLGKTVMMAALIAISHSTAPTLIVLPLTLLSQWESELHRHTKHLSVLLYYSSQRNRYAKELKNFNVVLTTYGTLAQEYSRGLHVSNEGVYGLQWKRIILDEAHYIKGRVIQTAKAAYALKGISRWCLTGTPIQNSLTDLFSLLHFIRYTPWSQFECWNKYISKPHQAKEQHVFQLLKTVLKRVFLRRTKQSKDANNEPIVVLPPRTSRIQLLTMSEKEREFYDAIYEASKLEIEQLEKLGALQAKYMQVLQILMRLRQICCHPLLFKAMAGNKTDAKHFEDELRKFVSKRTVSEEVCFQPIMEGDEEIRTATTSTYFDTIVSKVLRNELQKCLVCLQEISQGVITSCLHVFCKLCAIRQIAEIKACSACRRRLTKQDYMNLPRATRFSAKDEYYPSAKMLALRKHLLQLQPEDKAVVFSQFLGMLDLIERELKAMNIAYVRMEGCTTQKDRSQIIDAFQNDPSIRLFIVSLKTAGVGLNLVAANKVFLMDPWWNPGVQDQAIERVHRIGQKREVSIIRFIVDKTIEQRMMELNFKKKQLSNNVFHCQQYGENKMEKIKYLMEKY